jgi:hypothetical protein
MVSNSYYPLRLAVVAHPVVTRNHAGCAESGVRARVRVVLVGISAIAVMYECDRFDRIVEVISRK